MDYMKLLKKFGAIIVCFVVIFIATGCATVQYSRVINTDGSIVDAFCVKLDQSKIESAGVNITTVKTKIAEKMNLYLDALFNAFDNRESYYFDMDKIVVRQNVSRQIISENEYVIARLKFKNYTVFKYFYGLSDSETDSDTSKTVKTFLYNKNITTGKTIFSGDYSELIDEFASLFDYNYSTDDVNFSFLFGSPQNQLHSDANYCYEVDGVTYHEWILNDKNQDINYYTYQIKPVNWYILALALTLALILILFVISILKKNKKGKTLPINVKSEDDTYNNIEKISHEEIEDQNKIKNNNLTN